MQSDKKRRKIAKINTKSKEKFAFSARIIFGYRRIGNFFPGMIYIIYVYTYIYIYICVYFTIIYLCIHLQNTSRLEEADRLYRQAIAMRSDYIQVCTYVVKGTELDLWNV